MNRPADLRAPERTPIHLIGTMRPFPEGKMGTRRSESGRRAGVVGGHPGSLERSLAQTGGSFLHIARRAGPGPVERGVRLRSSPAPSRPGFSPRTRWDGENRFVYSDPPLSPHRGTGIRPRHPGHLVPTGFPRRRSSRGFPGIAKDSTRMVFHPGGVPSFCTLSLINRSRDRILSTVIRNPAAAAPPPIPRVRGRAVRRPPGYRGRGLRG